MTDNVPETLIDAVKHFADLKVCHEATNLNYRADSPIPALK